MFHKGKRRRRFINFASIGPEVSLAGDVSELARIASSFEPIRYELGDPVIESAALSEEREREEPATKPIASVRAASEVPAGEKVFHFGCYSPSEKIYWEGKDAAGADRQVERE
jgi:hypothetical protein